MSRQAWAVGALLIAGAALAYIAFGNVGENLVYYWTPADMVAAGDKAQGATIRLGGMVEAGSIRQDGTTLTFRVTDGGQSVPVTTNAIPPQMFREGIGVVVEGTVDNTGMFRSERLLVKHDNEYRAPKDGAAPDMASMMKSLEANQ